MAIMLRDLVDFDKVSEGLGNVGSHKAREMAREVVISRARELTLNDALRGVDYTNYVRGISNASMAKELYERLVPVHDIEKGVVAPVYFVNQPFMENGKFCERIDGIYSSDIITYWSCAGHLPGEPQTGRDTGRIKPPCMFFFSGWDLKGKDKEEYGRMLNLLRRGKYDVTEMGGFGVGVCGKISSDNEDEVIAQMQDFWRSFLGDLNEHHKRNIFDLRLAEVIRPSARVPKV